MTAANACSVVGSLGSASDNLQIALSGAPTAADYTAIIVSENGTARSTTAGSPGGSDAYVTSAAAVNYTFATNGPERPGYVEVLFASNLDTEYTLADLGFSLGSLQGGCSSHMTNCALNVPPVTPLLPERFYSFTLGDTFAVNLAYNDCFSTLQDSAITPVSGSFALEFRFFEADLATPVAVSPEPRGLALAGLALIAILGRRKRNRTIAA